MTDVFISYAREDGDFVRRLHAALRQAGRESWVDWEGIPPSAEWMREIHEAIEAADTFVAVLSPASVGSEICRAEAAYAEEQGKRLVPIVVRDVEPAETLDALARLNWLFFRSGDDFDDALERLLEALDTDLEHLKLHTWLLVRCQRWARGGEDPSSLLRGSELAAAEGWLGESAGREPAPTPAQTRFVVASRRRQTVRQRRLLAGVAAALVVSVTLGVLAWVQRGQAIEARIEADRQRDLAVARSLATSSELALDGSGDGLVVSTLLAVESLRRVATAEGEAAWERAMALLPPPPLIESEPLGEISAGALSHDGRFWAAGDGAGRVHLGETSDGAVLESWPALDSAVRSLAFGPEARWLVAAGREAATVWQVEGRVQRLAAIEPRGSRLDAFGDVHAAAFARDGSRLFLAAEGFGVEVISAEGWRRLAPLPTPESRAFRLAVHPARDLLVVGGFGLTLFDLGTGEGRQIADARREEIDALAFSREGWELASSDFAVRIWDLDLADDGSLRLLPADRLVASDDRVLALDFAPGGRYLAVGREAGTAHLRVAKTGEEVDRMVEDRPVRAVGFDAQGGRLFTISDRFRVWRAASGAEVHRAVLDGAVTGAFLLAEGRWLAARTDAGKLWILDPDGLERRLSIDLAAGGALTTSADGSWLAAATRDGLMVLEASTLETGARLDSRGAPLLAAFTPDSRFLAATGRGFASLLDVATLTWRELLPEQQQRVGRPVFHGEGSWLSFEVGPETRLFRGPDWAPLPPVRGELLSSSPDGAVVCTRVAPRRGDHPGIDIAWQAASGRELGSVGLSSYLGKSPRDFGSGDSALAESCEEWPALAAAVAAEPALESRRWRLATSDRAVLLFARQTTDRIAEACRRVPRQLTPAEWGRFMADETYRATCESEAGDQRPAAESR